MSDALGRGDTGEEDSFATIARHCFFTITVGSIARPEADRGFIVTEIDDVVASLSTADGISPPDFQKITRLSLLPIREVDSAAEVGH